jgi:hypothetical protein
LLLEHGADARVRTKRNETALGNAATSGLEETVKLLLDKGAEVNVRNARGFSPLMLAASSDTMPAGVIRLLLAAGADQSFKGDYDETARDLAVKRGDTEVTRLLGGGVRARVAPAVAHTAGAGAPERSIAGAVEKALALVEKQSHNFIRIAGCNSCHSQDLPSAAAALARRHGLAAPRAIAQLPTSMTPPPERVMDLNVVNVVSIAWELFDLGMNGVAKNAYTDAAVRYIKAMQRPSGNWSMVEGRRPPMIQGEFQAAALSIYALKHYSPALEQASTDQAIAKAVAWLGTATPVITQDNAFQVLGLAWGGNAEKAQSADRWWMEPVVHDGVGRLRHGRSALCPQQRWQHPGDRSGVPKGRRLFTPYPGDRRILACALTRHLAAAVLRERLPAWPGPVHFNRWDSVGLNGADAGSPACDDDPAVSAYSRSLLRASVAAG